MSDLDHIMAVMDAAFDPLWREAWTRRQVEDSLILPHTYAVVVDPDGQDVTSDSTPAGFIFVRRTPGEEELLLIAIHPDHRGKGLGRKLMEQFLTIARNNGAKNVFLEMRANNPAEKLYKACGFEPIGRRKDYYRTTDGERIDAITFGRAV